MELYLVEVAAAADEDVSLLLLLPNNDEFLCLEANRGRLGLWVRPLVACSAAVDVLGALVVLVVFVAVGDDDGAGLSSLFSLVVSVAIADDDDDAAWFSLAPLEGGSAAV